MYFIPPSTHHLTPLSSRSSSPLIPSLPYFLTGSPLIPSLSIAPPHLLTPSPSHSLILTLILTPHSSLPHRATPHSLTFSPPHLLTPSPPHSHKQRFCAELLLHLPATNGSGEWSLYTKALALTALRISARDPKATEKLLSEDSLRPIVELADLSEDSEDSCFSFGEKASVSRLKGVCRLHLAICSA